MLQRMNASFTGSIYDPQNIQLTHYLDNALKAQFLFHRDDQYIVNPEGEIVIVDEFTGRLMPGRRYSEGLHQAIEAKEGVRVQRENVTLARITFQNYFRMYEKLAGMTGTAWTEREEFQKIYDLDVVVIPTHKPMIRGDQAGPRLQDRGRQVQRGHRRDRRVRRRRAAGAGRHDVGREVRAAAASCCTKRACRTRC